MTSNTFTTAHEEVIKLCDTFTQSLDKYNESTYNESQVRKDFLDKFFVILGWDVNHVHQTNPYEQEVKVEQSVTVAARVKKADYAFYLKPNFRDERFFVEAKKPSVQLETADNVFQTIRYAYSSSRASLSLLTNFKEFYIIDCRFRPDIKTALNHIHKKFSCSDFRDADKFGEIFYLFGREAVANGSLETYTETLPKPKGKVKQRKLFADGFRDLDDDFLAKLEEYRTELAKMFKRKNPHLNGDDLTEATQRTLDRLVFIRFLEDKLIEPSTILDKFGEKPHAWKEFVGKSKEFDKSYNGIIFKTHPIIDAENFATDDKVFVDICDDFASKYSPYHFNYIPIHILGSIYERFLGNVIIATEKQARVEAKPEVRKAGGVFYTPEYIVRYIVENTIGKMLEKKTPKEVAEMRFADIACGSGSFLLGVYDYLLRWHTNYYNLPKNKAEAKKAGCVSHADGTFHLSFEQKREILVNNIYGTDIDRQAFEVTQLSLFLKLLEEETQGSTQGFLTGFREALLPSLANNIQCGNALVDWDVTSGDLLEQLDYEKERKLNPMSFINKFPDVMKKGGFDAIVGNPPYVRQELISHLKSYLQKHYDTYHGVADLYVYFFEKYVKILRPDGEFSIIVANKWMRANYGEPLRRWLKKLDIVEIIDFGDLPVFQNATTYPCVIRVRNNQSDSTFNAVNVGTLDFGENGLASYVDENLFAVNQDALDNGGWTLTNQANQNLLAKLRKVGVPLAEYVNGEIYYGIKTGLNEAFVIDEATKNKLIAEDARSAELIKPFLAGRDVKRYVKPTSDKYLIFTRRGVNIKDFPAIENYLSKFKTQLTPKPKNWEGKEWKGRKVGNYAWYEIQDTVDYFNKFESIKIIIPTIIKKASFILDKNSWYSNDKTTIIANDSLYLLGLLNSKAVDFVMHSISSTKQGGYYEYKPMYVSQLPIRSIDFNNPTEKATHDDLVGKVEQIMQAKIKLNGASNDGEREFYENKCSALENAIDEIVYRLYDLTPEEIELVNG